ncbi:hypothetical protein [Alkalimonas mucilaginosa]|uniref:Uncharacterized protein n=1 Tax=Alkalimonas mucilaginosa TaxID=3057676 RepID=A0ABU7JI31_9GAMM|nr:hypothetical protein [Alkalimonas sp. MEB004]MEE2025130.1 hypothetical protein [Alkalimonas sp. MEB004]
MLPLKYSVLALCIYASPFTIFASEFDLLSECLDRKSALEAVNVDVLTWKPIEESNHKLPVLKLWGLSIPIVANQSPDIGIFNDVLSKRLALLDFDNGKLQTIETDTFYSKKLNEEIAGTLVSEDDLFTILMESFAIRLSDLDCHAFQLRDMESENYLLHSRKLMLLLVKANYKPYKATGAIELPSGFIITLETGFEYHTMRGGVSTSVTVFTNDSDDLYSFINTLNQPAKREFTSHILDEIVAIWDDDSPATWMRLHVYLKSIDAPQTTLDLVSEVAEKLTIKQKEHARSSSY